MRILYLITRGELGGAQVHVADLVDAMKTRADVSVAAGEKGYLAEFCEQRAVPFHLVNHLVQPIRPAKDYRCIKELIALIERERPDLIHVHTSKAGLLGRIAAKITSTPIVFTAHTWSFADGIGIPQILVAAPCEWVAGRLCNQIIAVSESNRKRALRYDVCPPDRITTIWNGVPDSPMRAKPGRADVPRLIMVARFASQKDHITLLRALASVNISFRLTLVGDGPTRVEAMREAARLNLNGKVEFVGSRRDIDSLLADSDAFVLSTKWEGFPLTIIEAMRAGLPVIATDVDGVGEAVVGGETGFTVPRGDVQALGSVLHRILSTPSLRASMGRAARSRYEELFSLNAMVQKTWAVYRDVLMQAGSQAWHEVAATGRGDL